MQKGPVRFPPPSKLLAGPAWPEHVFGVPRRFHLRSDRTPQWGRPAIAIPRGKRPLASSLGPSKGSFESTPKGTRREFSRVCLRVFKPQVQSHAEEQVGLFCPVCRGSLDSVIHPVNAALDSALRMCSVCAWRFATGEGRGTGRPSLRWSTMFRSICRRPLRLSAAGQREGPWRQAR